MWSVRASNSFSWCFYFHWFCQVANSYAIPVRSSKSLHERNNEFDQVGDSGNYISNNPAILVGPIVGLFVLCGAVVWLIKRNSQPAVSQPPPAPVVLPTVPEKPLSLREPSIPAARASWEGYVEVPLNSNSTGQGGTGAGAALQHSFSVSTQKLYISNQIKRARKKEREIERERQSVSFPSVPLPLSVRTAAAESPSSEDGESDTVGSASRSDRTVRQSGQSSTDADTVRHSPSRESLQDRLFGAREEIEILNSRIRELEGRHPRSPEIVEVGR